MLHEETHAHLWKEEVVEAVIEAGQSHRAPEEDDHHRVREERCEIHHLHTANDKHLLVANKAHA